MAAISGKRRLARGFSVVFGPDARRDYDGSSSDLDKIVFLAEAVEADFLEIRFFGEAEQRGKGYYIPEKVFDAKDIEETIQHFKDRGFLLNLHLSEELLGYLDNPQLLGYPEFLKQFYNIVGHFEEEENFLWSLENRLLSELINLDVLSREAHIRSIGGPFVIPQEFRDKLLIENGFEVNNIFYISSAVANKYNIKNTFDLCHFVRGQNHHLKKRRDKPKNYVRYAQTGPELVYPIKKACQDTPHFHVGGVEWSPSENRYRDHITLKKPYYNIPRRQQFVLNQILKNTKSRSYTIELRKQYHTAKNLKMTAENFETMLERTKNG